MSKLLVEQVLLPGQRLLQTQVGFGDDEQPAGPAQCGVGIGFVQSAAAPYVKSSPAGRRWPPARDVLFARES